MSAYLGNRDGANESAIESSPIGAMILKLAEGLGEPWQGTAAELKAALEGLLPRSGEGPVRPPHGWPKTPKGLSGDLRRLSPNLRAIGIEVSFDRVAGGKRKRIIGIERVGDNASQPSQPSRESAADDGRDARDARDAISPPATETDAESSDDHADDGEDGEDLRL